MPAPERRPDSASRLIPLAACAAGLLAVFHPTILSGFARIQTDPGDTLLNNYILEHGYRWITGRLTAGFWDPPIFFPVSNVAGYADILLGAAPVYWLWRVLGFLPDTSFQLWQLSVAALDFGVFYWWARLDFGLRPASATAGAMVFAFGAPRVAQLFHAQFLPHFFTILALHGVFLAFRDRAGAGVGAGEPPTAFRRACALAIAGSVLQIYASFYLGWFLALALVATGLVAIALGQAPRLWRDVVVRDIRGLVVLGLLAAAALLPMVLPYARAAKVTGSRPIPPVLMMLPRPASWFAADPGNWLYGWTARWPSLAELPFRAEHSLMFGLVTLAAACAGLVAARRRRGIALMGITALVLVVLVTMWWPDHTLWLWVRSIVPGAKAIRSAGRIVLLLSIPVGLGLACAVDRLLARNRAWLAALLAVVCVAEQITTTASFDKHAFRAVVAREAAMIPAGCRAFLLTPRLAAASQPDWLIQVVPMWVSMTTGLPTLNGYSGNEPPGWQFRDSAILTGADEARLAGALAAWTSQHGLDSAAVCWIKPDRR